MEGFGGDEHMMGTSIMAVQFKDGVVLGADSRTTTGSFIANRVTNKITRVHEKIFVCRSGSAADTQTLSDYVTYYLKMHCGETGEAPAVKTAASLFQQLCYANKNHLLAGVIVAGVDQDGPSVWTIPLGGTLIKQPFSIGGSGSTYIFGYCDANYRPNMTQDECVNFVVNALTLAMARDGSSGGLIRTVVLTRDGAVRNMIPGDRLNRIWEG
ncbi:Proteasome subunit beta type-1 [Pelomyxa schiedti]|nr:Proteasome subunit beta type-1 [Pelomyxa schiedti]